MCESDSRWMSFPAGHTCGVAIDGLANAAGTVTVGVVFTATRTLLFTCALAKFRKMSSRVFSPTRTCSSSKFFRSSPQLGEQLAPRNPLCQVIAEQILDDKEHIQAHRAGHNRNI
ncbi:hypothetical protein MRX96_048331 [Rhipicephalus microplus]